MELDIKTLISFPPIYQDITTGLYLQDKNILITGHSKGLLIKWDLKSGKEKIIFSEDSDVRTLSINDIYLAVGYRSGGLYLINIDNDNVTNIIKPEYSKYKRIWKVLWLDKQKLLITSTYGNLSVINFDAESYSKIDYYPKEHDNSIFAAEGILQSFYATGDWIGKINIWLSNDENRTVLATLNITDTVQDINWKDERYISVIDETGKIYFFEMSREAQFYWRNVVELNVAKGNGKCITLTDDFESIFAGTTDNLIQFDLDTQQYDEIEIKNVQYVYSIDKEIFVLNNYGLYSFIKKKVDIKKELVSYKYVKISLLGYTGTGKSTFCKWFVDNVFEDQPGTLGKQIWTYDLPELNGIKRRLLLNDFGGQENVLESFLPYVLDSDIIFLFYKKKDNKTLDKALDIIDFIKNDINKKCRIYLIETHVDDPVEDVINEEINYILENQPLILSNIQVSPKTNIGREEIDDIILSSINWTNVRSIIQSELFDIINNTLYNLKNTKTSSITVEKFKFMCEKQLKQAISDKYFRFILEDYKNKGIIDYYPKYADKIILNDDEYNKLSTNIPIYIRAKNGIIIKDDLITKFGDKEYVKLLIDLYLNTKICYDFIDKFIFPYRLNNEYIELPKVYEDNIDDKFTETFLISNFKIKIKELIDILSDQKLQCILVSKNSGLFEWSKNAFIYYDFSEKKKGIREIEIICNFYIGGENEDIKIKLKQRFIDILNTIYGESSVNKYKESNEEDKKKDEIDYPFNVALSFAGEQRGYVEEIYDILSGSGLEVFYDKERVDLIWGEYLPEYLKDIFGNKAKYCIMFISNEYMTKYYPTIERESAIKRQIETKKKYILPVIMDDVNFPEIKDMAYIDGRKQKPSYIAESFIKMWEKQK